MDRMKQKENENANIRRKKQQQQQIVKIIDLNGEIHTYYSLVNAFCVYFERRNAYLFNLLFFNQHITLNYYEHNCNLFIGNLLAVFYMFFILLFMLFNSFYVKR